MAYLRCTSFLLPLLLTASSLLMSSDVLEARQLLETTLPTINPAAGLPKPEFPPLPTIPAAFPKAQLPPLPQVLTFPKPELQPFPQIPTLPKPELPQVPEVPGLPKPTLPTIPSLSPPHSTTSP